MDKNEQYLRDRLEDMESGLYKKEIEILLVLLDQRIKGIPLALTPYYNEAELVPLRNKLAKLNDMLR